MTDFPAATFPAQPAIISTVSCLGPELVGIVGNVETITGAYPSANLAIFVPFQLSAPFLAAQMFVANGGTVSGNVDVGIYDTQGNRLVSKGSTAQSGTSALQPFDIADTWLQPGCYYMAVALDNATGIINHYVPGVTQSRQMGVLQAATSFPLPATVTFAAIASNYLPSIGIASQAVI
jgi:hypothetical protein